MVDNSTFKFTMPASLEKSKEGDWTIRGLASTQEVDQQGEILMQKGIDLSPIDQKRGVLNWEHQKGAENTIGLLDGYSLGDQGLYISGRLFKNHDKAKAVHQIMSSLGEKDVGRVGLSVEGSILERSTENSKVIKKCRINAVALTMNPVNSNTYASLVKSMSAGASVEFNALETTCGDNKENAAFTASQVLAIVQKALGVGVGYEKPPNELTDGAAMATSNMKSPKKKKKKKVPESADLQSSSKLKMASPEIYKSMMLNMLEKLQVLYPGNSRSELWEAVRERLVYRFPEVYQADDE